MEAEDMLIKTDITVNGCTVWVESDETDPNALYKIRVAQGVIAEAVKATMRYSWKRAMQGVEDGERPG